MSSVVPCCAARRCIFTASANLPVSWVDYLQLSHTISEAVSQLGWSWERQK